MQSIYFPSSNGESEVHAAVWMPEQPPVAAMLLIHGMTEHIGRYEPFASHLNKRSIAVFGIDLPGHGKSAASREELGYFGARDAGQTLCDDLHTLRVEMERRCPDLPYFALGHSMGSFVLRRYLLERAQGLAGVILSGTGDSPRGSGMGLRAARILKRLLGGHYRSGYFDRFAFSKYNDRLPGEPKESRAWLCRDPEVVRAYEEDEACGFVFTVSAYADMIAFTRAVNSPSWFRDVPKELPILMVAGDADPVGRYGEGVCRVYEQLVGAGAERVRCILYGGGRHEMLNDPCRERVYSDILGWMLDPGLRRESGLERVAL